MGKSIIIKGADFSANAVAHEPVAPSVFINTAGYGETGVAGYTNNDYYFRINTSNTGNVTNANCGLYQKVSGSAVAITGADNQYVKINGMYFILGGSGKDITPYYGLGQISMQFTNGVGKKFVNTTTPPTDITNNVYQYGELSLTKGVKYIIFFYGITNTNATPVIINKNGVYENMGFTGLRYLTEYTPQTDGEIIMLSCNNSYLTWIAEQ